LVKRLSEKKGEVAKDQCPVRERLVARLRKERPEAQGDGS